MFRLVKANGHYNDVMMGAMVSQITSPTIIYSTVYSGADQRKHQSTASLAFVRGIHRWPVNSPHKGPVTRKMFPFDGVMIVKFIPFTVIHCHSFWFHHWIHQVVLPNYFRQIQQSAVFVIIMTFLYHFIQDIMRVNSKEVIYQDGLLFK